MTKLKIAVLICALSHTLMATNALDASICPTVDALRHHQVLGNNLEIRWDNTQNLRMANVTEYHVALKDSHNQTAFWTLLASFFIEKNTSLVSLDGIQKQAQQTYAELRTQPSLEVDAYGGFQQCLYLVNGNKQFIVAERSS